MSLVRWMRKNHTRIMVVVLIIIMVGFVIGASLPVIINRFVSRIAAAKVVATYGDDGKISEIDYRRAQTEVNILQQLYANEYLTYLGTQNKNYKALLLSQMIFQDQQAPLVSNFMKQKIISGELQVTSAQVDDFFIQINTTRPEIYWLMLNAEAKAAGCAVAPEDAEKMLQQILPSVTGGRPASQLVKVLVSEYRLTTEQIYDTYARLLAITSYVDMVTSSEDVTVDQVRALLGRSGEKITAEFIRLTPDTESAQLDQPTDQQIDEQFQKYKTLAPADISSENPFGFGYKIPASLEIEYLIVKLDDVKKLVDKPTEEEMEDYYRNNIESFKSQRPENLSNPKSGKITITRDYAEVAGQIRERIVQGRTITRANMIMNDAVEITEAYVAGMEPQERTSETYTERAIEFSEASQKLKESHDIDIFTGKTGRLSISDLINDPVLGILNIDNQNTRGIGLDKIAFAVEGLAETKLGRFDVAPPKMFQNIGPMKNDRGSMVALVRVVAVHPAAEAENVNVSFSRKPPVIDNDGETSDNTFSVKDEVIKDLKTVKAMEIAKAAADQLLTLIEEKGWDDAITAFNEAKKDEEDSVIGTVSLATSKNKMRSSLFDKKLMEIGTTDNRTAEMFKLLKIKDDMLIEKLYSLLPMEKTKAEDLREIFCFEPGKSCYIVKSIEKVPATEEDYYKEKNRFAFLLDMNRSMSLAFVHLSPENLLKRTNFERVKQEKDDESITSDEDNQEEDAGS